MRGRATPLHDEWSRERFETAMIGATGDGLRADLAESGFGAEYLLPGLVGEGTERGL